MKPVKVVVDTNVWISVLIGKRLSKLAPLLDNGRIRLVMSDTLLKELELVMARPKFRRYFPEEVAKGFLLHLMNHSDIYIIDKIEKICRDEKDDFLLALSRKADADLLVSGDKDLLVLNKVGNTAIVSVDSFQTMLCLL